MGRAAPDGIPPAYAEILRTRRLSGLQRLVFVLATVIAVALIGTFGAIVLVPVGLVALVVGGVVHVFGEMTTRRTPDDVGSGSVRLTERVARSAPSRLHYRPAAVPQFDPTHGRQGA